MTDEEYLNALKMVKNMNFFNKKAKIERQEALNIYFAEEKAKRLKKLEKNKEKEKEPKSKKSFAAFKKKESSRNLLGS